MVAMWWKEIKLPWLVSWYDMLTLKLRRLKRMRYRYNREISPAAKQKKRLMWLKWARYAALGFAGLSVLSIIGFFVLLGVYAKELPEAGEVIRQSGFSTRIYDRHQELLSDLYSDQNRTLVNIADVPQHLRDATVAIEDKDFYKHSGFDPLVFLRAPYYLLFEGRLVGGSTLTQQLVKKSMLTDELSFDRKFKQILLSLAIERKFEKEQILEMYLNEVPYGGTAYGIGAAANMYFNKSVQDLSLLESAVLAGLPQRPSAYSPLFGKKDEDDQLLWQVRTKGVLRRMFEDGYITQLAYDEALGSLDSIQFEKGQSSFAAPHFVFYIKDQLEEMFGPERVEAGGLQVTTTLDLALHNQAQEIVAEEIEKVKDINITNGAVVVMDPRSGEIYAMVGSRDFNDPDIDGQYNVAVQGLRQPGSSIKPVVYLTMLQQGYNPATMMIDLPTNFQRNENEKPYQPRNYDGRFRGPVSLRNSLGSSLNVPAVKALGMVGIETFLDQAYAMGLVTLEPTKENLQRLGLSVALGGGEVHLIDLSTAYSSFANSGLKVEPVSIFEVKDRNGNIIFEHRQAEGARVMEEADAFLINNILSDDSARAMAFGLNSKLNISPSVAVKTGTTNDQKDNWAIGWSREVLVGAWVGNNDNTSMKTVASGISGATPIWQRIMLLALKSGFDDPEFVKPDNVEQAEVDLISGYPAHDEFPKRFEWVKRGTLPDSPDPIHAKLRLCPGENKLATDAKIVSGDYEKKEFIILEEHDPYSEDGRNRWQESVDAWRNEQADSRYRPPTEYCGDQTEVFVRLDKPEDKENYEDTKIEIKVRADAGSGIEKMEIIVDGKVWETINDNRYEGDIKLKRGRYTIWVKAYSRDGEETESDKKRIGVGGETWNEPTPTQVPPTSTPAPKPTSVPSPTTEVIKPPIKPSATPIPILTLQPTEPPAEKD